MKSNNILISSAGRRVGLLACIRDSIAARQGKRVVLTIDAVTNAPACIVSDGFAQVPPCTDRSFAETVLKFCIENRVGLVIPTIDTELPAYAAASREFADAGVTVSISSAETVRICGNKIDTHAWLVQHGFPTVRQTCLCEVLRHPDEWPLPLIAKPSAGSASIGIRRVETVADLHCLEDLKGDYVIQEVAQGSEFTVNFYVSKAGHCVCAIPHLRIEIRAGEVSKGVTIKNQKLMDLAREIASALPNAYGALNMQCFIDDGAAKIIELNARFGGGYPLAHRAGARFTDWLLDEQEGKSLSWFDGWIDELTMLRYDEAIFMREGRILA